MTATFVDNEKTGVKIMDWEVASSGYAAVWATENTRDLIWDAMQRKETYATTGPRMIVRFFGGWDFAAGRRRHRAAGRHRYTKACRWAAICRDAPKGKSPTFLVAALKDPIGANLDRFQIVKGWLDAKARSQEKVYDVVWSGDRKPGADGKVPPVGNTVDVANATWTQHHRRARTDHGLEGPGLRSLAARLLLRTRASKFRRRAGLPTTPSSRNQAAARHRA